MSIKSKSDRYSVYTDVKEEKQNFLTFQDLVATNVMYFCLKSDSNC